ncbi:hypothetical protein BGW36DRAFT_368462 [Talaromyces proteolyticus]|uniref:Uncharacterized protein n=1 Tax=Talaromyces proteolyticus TaxID=1131652 RepID=A0AAD4L4R9_9EURO|nr:uncharacterized protein BGW36DRAFT_368462 [Talaromyces proteolyticus]KAH8705952.1 hypothetical protein BGW36DRAFT_368462 [Talaromyces proteolyticus]
MALTTSMIKNKMLWRNFCRISWFVALCDGLEGIHVCIQWSKSRSLVTQNSEQITSENHCRMNNTTDRNLGFGGMAVIATVIPADLAPPYGREGTRVAVGAAPG